MKQKKSKNLSHYFRKGLGHGECPSFFWTAPLNQNDNFSKKKKIISKSLFRFVSKYFLFLKGKDIYNVI